MKKTLSVIAQFVLFLLLDTIGGIFYHPLQVETSLNASGGAPRSFVWDGLIFMFLAYLLILLIHALRKHLKRSAPWSTVALLLAAVAGYLLKIGFITHNW